MKIMNGSILPLSDLDDAVTAALDRTWSKIQALDPSVPDATWYLTSGRSMSCATGPWNDTEDMVLRINLMRGDQNRDGRDLVGQLLHWAAHAVTGAEGRYHSAEFRDVAERLGLEIEWRDGVAFMPKMIEVGGHKIESLSRDGLKRFTPEIKTISKAMAAWVPGETASKTAIRIKDRGPVAIVCQCTDPKRSLRASQGVALGPGIRCEKCGQLFRIAPGQRISEADRK
jgi:hypothetical protein